MDFSSLLMGLLKSLVPPALTRFLPKLCGVRIESPLDHSVVEHQTLVVKGRYRWTLGQRLALFHQQGKKYWPQESPNFDPKHKAWEGRVSIGSNAGEQYTIVVAAVSEDLQHLLSYYGQVHGETGKWVPITLNQLPKGLTEVDRIVVTKK